MHEEGKSEVFNFLGNLFPYASPQRLKATFWILTVTVPDRTRAGTGRRRELSLSAVTTPDGGAAAAAAV